MYFKLVLLRWLMNLHHTHETGFWSQLRKKSERYFKVKIFLGFQSWQNPISYGSFHCAPLSGRNRIFLGEGAPVRSGITDWWGKQILVLEANMKKKASWKRGVLLAPSPPLVQDSIRSHDIPHPSLSCPVKYQETKWWTISLLAKCMTILFNN